MEKTLWELAQEWPHENEPITNFIEGRVSREVVHLPSCHRCQLEQWARQKAKEYGDSFEIAEEGLFIPLHRIESDLGVPEEKP